MIANGSIQFAGTGEQFLKMNAHKITLDPNGYQHLSSDNGLVVNSITLDGTDVDGRFLSVENRTSGCEYRLDGAETRLTTAEGRLDGAESRITATENDIATHATRITAAESSITDHSSHLSSIDTSLSAHNTVLTSHATHLGDLDSSVGLRSTIADPSFTGVVTLPRVVLTDSVQVGNTSMTITPMELSYVKNLTGNVQDTIDRLDGSLTTKAPLSSATLVGVPTCPDVAFSSTVTNQIINKKYCDEQISALVGSAPSTLNTLSEIAAAINADNSFSTTMVNLIGTKAPIANPSFTGTLTCANFSCSGSIADVGNLSVAGNCILGDSPAVDILTCNGKSTFNADLFVASGVTTVQALGATDITCSSLVVSSGVNCGSLVVGGGISLVNNSLSNAAITAGRFVETSGDQSINGTKTFQKVVAGSLTVNGAISFPASSIAASCIVPGTFTQSNVDSTITAGRTYTTGAVVFGNGFSVTGGSLSFPSASIPSGVINDSANILVGVSSAQTISGAKVFSNGLTVQNGLSITGAVSFPTSSIASTCINNSSFCDIGSAQSLSGVKTFNSIPVMQAGINVGTTFVTFANNSISSASILNTTFADLASNQTVGGNKYLTGQSRVKQVYEDIYNTGSISGNSVALNYNNGSSFFASPINTSATTATITNIPTANTYTCYTISLLLDTSSQKVYCTLCTVNGTAVTPLFVGGVANISVSSATAVIQTFYVVFTGSSSAPWKVISSVSPCF
jgi:hypothetical protein